MSSVSSSLVSERTIFLPMLSTGKNCASATASLAARGRRPAVRLISLTSSVRELKMTTPDMSRAVTSTSASWLTAPAAAVTPLIPAKASASSVSKPTVETRR